MLGSDKEKDIQLHSEYTRHFVQYVFCQQLIVTDTKPLQQMKCKYLDIAHGFLYAT